MELDYKDIGSRIAARRKKLGLKQSEVEERAKIGYKYLSNKERGISIPSKSIADMLKRLDSKQLGLVKSFLKWLSER